MTPAALFLDFDGPLFNWRTQAAGDRHKADPLAASAIINAIRKLRSRGFDAHIVISSSWRHQGRVDCLTAIDGPLAEHVHPHAWCITGQEWTPERGNAGTRALNIHAYCQSHGIDLRHALVVDDYDMRQHLPPVVAFVRANEMEGLLSRDLKSIGDWADHCINNP